MARRLSFLLPTSLNTVLSWALACSLSFLGVATLLAQPAAVSVDLGQDTVFSPSMVPGVGNTVLFATNSLQVERDTVILSGDLVVNLASPGPTLTPGFELDLQKNVTTPEGYAVRADSVRVDAGTVVGGDLASNELVNHGTVVGTLISPLALPVLAELPPFESALPRFGAPAIVVPGGGSMTLDPGSYDTLTVEAGATVVLRPGIFHFTSIDVGRGGALLYGGPVDVRTHGRFFSGTDAVIGPIATTGADGSDAVFYVGGFNGADGALGSLPPAAWVGRNTTMAATFYVPFGTLQIDTGTEASGAYFARDLQVRRGSTIALDSAFADRPPTADPQTVFTSGAEPVEIILTGHDPEGQDLGFSIVSGPSFGTLSGLAVIVPDPVTDPETGETAQPPVTSARVDYTPSTSDDVEDSFVFRVTDVAGGSGLATVRINPPPSDALPETVVAEDLSASVARDTEAILTFVAGAPDGVALAYTVLSSPSHGTLGPLTPGAESPVRTATASYTPATSFVGTDSLTFEACGTIAGVLTCDQALFTIEVFEPPVEPPDLAVDQQVTTFGGVPAPIDLSGGGAVGPQAAVVPRTFVLTPRAAYLDPAEVAGNVADADGDGLGDNHNDLPGPVPVFIAAGVDGEGGPGSNGVRRIHIEWTLSGVPTPATDLLSADVILHTHRGSIDSLDTVFFAGGLDEEGVLEDSDFESPLEQVPGVVMPVPSLDEMPLGSDGTFQFSVLGVYAAAVEAGANAFVVQGRVDEQLAGTGTARGLEVRSSADSNVADFLEPQLSITTPGVTPATLYTVLTLPANGTLFDSFGTPITTAPTLLSGSTLTYSASVGFLGLDSFTFQVDDGLTVDQATVDITVVLGDCATNVLFCDDGRE